MLTRNNVYAFAFLAAAAMLSACGKEADGPPPPPEVGVLTLAPADVLPVGPGAAVLVMELEADPVGQLLDGLVEGDVVQLLDEGDDVAVLAAAKAVVPANLGSDGEGG